MASATDKGLVRACHDLSEGGLSVALAEMAFSGGLGAHIDLKKVPQAGDLLRDDYLLFSESNSRLLVEVSPENRRDFELLMGASAISLIGAVTEGNRLIVDGLDGSQVVNRQLSDLKNAWQRPLKW